MMPQPGYGPPPYGHPQMPPQQYMQPHPHPHSHPHPHQPPPPHHHPQQMPVGMQTPQRAPPGVHHGSVQRPGPPHTPANPHYNMPPQHAMMTPQQTPGPGPGPTTGKRSSRPAPPMAAATGASAATMSVMENIEDEEDTSRGDVLDHLTPREISTQRYVQHHEWLEEVFNSVYPMGTIRPGSIGIEKLGGPLKPLVEGVFNKDGTPQDGKTPNEACQIVMERAKQMTADIEAEMAELKRQHAADLEEFRASIVLQAEKELRNAGVDEFMVANGLVLPSITSSHHHHHTHTHHHQHPSDDEMAKDLRSIDEIVAEVEKSLGVTIVERQVIHCWNPQPEIAEWEEQQAREAREAALAAEAEAKEKERLREEAAAQAAAAAAAAGSPNQGKDDAMDISQTKSTSPENARYLVPVVIDKAQAIAGPPVSNGTAPVGAAPTAPSATSTPGGHPSTASPLASTDIGDTTMADADPIEHTPAPPANNSVPAIPAAAAAAASASGTSGTPGVSPAPITPFAVPSPMPGGTGQTPQNLGTPGAPSPFPAHLGDIRASATPQPQPHGTTPGPGTPGVAVGGAPSAKLEEPPTIPDDDGIPEGFVGGDDDLDFGGDAAEAMDLLGANDSFADEFL